MNLASTIEFYLPVIVAGGPGSGPEAPCPQCGPESKGHYERVHEGIKVLSGSNVHKVHKLLSDGLWHHKGELADAIQRPKAVSSIMRLKKLGQKTGKWSIERSGSSYRMVLGKPLTERQESDSDALVEKARPFAEKWKNLSFEFHSQSYRQASKQLLSDYFKSVGVSDESKESLYSALSGWSVTSHNAQAQVLRKVASEYYNRKWPDDEYFGHSSKLASDWVTPDAVEKMRPAALAMKAYCKAVLDAEGVSTIYRGLTLPGKMLNEIKEAKETNHEFDGKIKLNSLSSWTTNSHLGFGNMTVQVPVDTNNVWAYYKITPDKFYSAGEAEVIVGHKSPEEHFGIHQLRLHKS